MADLEGRSKDLKDKVAGEGKEAYGKATGDRSKETEGKAQSVGADIKSKARNIGDEIKEISLYIAPMTANEKKIVKAGCLINYNRSR